MKVFILRKGRKDGGTGEKIEKKTTDIVFWNAAGVSALSGET